MPDLIFKSTYRKLGEVSQNRLGWSLLIPLEDADMHHLDAIRLLSGDEQRDFDEIVLSLTKLLLDSLNEANFKAITSNATDLPDGGIARLEYICRALGIAGFTDQIEFMRKLQKLRSSSAAHRKGSNYHKIAKCFGLDHKSIKTVVREIPERATEMLNWFTTLIEQGMLPSTAVDYDSRRITKP